MNKRKLIVGIICALIVQLIFGFSLVFTSFGLAVATPMSLLAWRFLCAFMIFQICIWLGIIQVNLKGKTLTPLLIIAVFFPFLYFVGETIGVNLTSASESGAMIAVIPIATLTFSALILKIKPSKMQALGILVSILGIIIIVIRQGIDLIFNPLGYAMLSLAVISYALYGVFAQKAKDFSASEKSYIMSIIGAVTFTILASIENIIHGTFTNFLLLPIQYPTFLLSILYLGIGSSIGAFLLYNTAIDCIGANRAVSFAGVSTVVAITSGILILNETFTLIQGIGAVLVIAGVYIANVLTKRKKS
ncbi:MAG: EamA family transporter [Lachnospiraceae bacterium]|nr:EamA family transporter [Lachnospiraceae bacterium]